MTNKEIATIFQDLASMMELHQENPFKIKSYKSAYVNLRKIDTPLFDLDPSEWGSIKGVGKSIVAKLGEIKETGTIANLSDYQKITPVGIQELLKLKGFGAKKIRTIWKDLGVESVGELLYACNENRLVELKGFGAKTQEDLRQKLEYFQQSKGKFHYATLDQSAKDLLKAFQSQNPDTLIELTGQMRRLSPVVSQIEILIGSEEIDVNALFKANEITFIEQKENAYLGKTNQDFPIVIYTCSTDSFGSKQFRYTASAAFMQSFLEKAAAKDFKGLATEQAVFEKAKIPFIVPELREEETIIDMAKTGYNPELIVDTDIKSVLHAHTTYSDGIHSLKDMATEAQRLGYEYIGITDHSKSAFYANGLKVDRLQDQFAEIDALNKTFIDFKIFKGIESDILNDGALDYDEDILKQFDFIIASIHSNLKMDEAKATQRLITAIENPYTTILGHPTGRLLLSRKGYPIDHQKVIDACAANNVVLELNANPYRLDLDWTWIPYAIEKGVKVSINPDAHSKEGIQHIHYGVLAARKGGLTKEHCFNQLSLAAFEAYTK